MTATTARGVQDEDRRAGRRGSAERDGIDDGPGETIDDCKIEGDAGRPVGSRSDGTGDGSRGSISGGGPGNGMPGGGVGPGASPRSRTGTSSDRTPAPTAPPAAG
ncbi:hypothetical protein ACFFX1_35980 [Dactylosporangium sucinum]|uniref:Uncharacterized protein n=1 Tax=Dactylosporangium sucinum TaxID=1424081 RepID=A0A917UDD5_9ACTN|nr:hypothetical protein [Dactylosporangium sucinum]GGM84679.1 hypothetical protein GCM10007977_102850 [Dactylosporangium sucinum]